MTNRDERTHSVLDDLVAEIVDFYRHIRMRPVAPSVGPVKIRERLTARYDFERPLALADVMADVIHMMRQWTAHGGHPRHLGLFDPGVGLASVVADALAALYNPQLAVWNTAPGAIEIEQHVLRALAIRLGFDAATCSASFTSGGAEANFTALLVALTRAHPSMAREGLVGLRSRPVIYLSHEGHGSFVKAAHAVGIGRDAVKRVACDASLALDPADLERQVQRDRSDGLAPLMAIATIGSTATGANDPMPAMADVCARNSLWLHAVAAWGGSAVLSPALAPYVDGLALADSITWDAHKWLGVSMGAGMFFCKHRDAVRDAFAVEAAYMPRDIADDRVQPFATTMQWSRRFAGLKVFMALAESGFEGYARRIEHQLAMVERLRTMLTNDGWTIVNQSPLPVLCFVHPEMRARSITPRRVLTYLYDHQIAWLSEARPGGGESVLRACVTNHATQARDIDAVVKGLRTALNALK